MSSYEFSEWMAYYKIDPFGEDRADFRNAIMCVLFGNAHKKKGARRFRIADFMPKWEKVVQTAKDMQKTLFAFAKAHNLSLENRKQRSGKHSKLISPANASDSKLPKKADK